MPLCGIGAAAYRGARVPEGTALAAPRHSAYLPVSRQMPHMSLRDTSGTRAPPYLKAAIRLEKKRMYLLSLGGANLSVGLKSPRSSVLPTPNLITAIR